MKRLLVLVLSSNDKLLEEVYEGLVFQRQRLIQKTRLEDISVLRGDFEFCLEQLKKEGRDRPAIVIAETAVYVDDVKYNGLLQAGATEVYHFGIGDAVRLELRFRECVLGFLDFLEQNS